MNKYISLSDYIEILLTDTLDGIISSEAANIEKINEVKSSVDLDNDEFYKLYITEEDIRNEILYLFPTDVLLVSSIDPGQPYIPETEDNEENPKIFRKLNYTMTSDDFIEANNEFFISEVGYSNLYNAEKVIYTNLKRSVIKQLVFRGIPNILVDKGQVTTPLNISSINIEKVDSLFEPGLNYRLYKEYDLDYNNIISQVPVKNGVCNNFNELNNTLYEINTVVFEGVISINLSDRYYLYLNASGRCILKIDDKKILYNYYGQKMSAAMELSEGYHKFYLICDSISIEEGIRIGFRTKGMRLIEEIGEEMFFHVKEDSFKQSYMYRGIEGDLQVVLNTTGSSNSNIKGELVLYYSINHG